MQLIINKTQLKNTLQYFLKRAGYLSIFDRHSKQESFTKPLQSPHHYPRFHIYIETTGEQIVFNLHLDQKEMSYEGATAHSGDYDGQAVEKEIARLQKLIG